MVHLERRSPRNMTSDQMGPATGGMMKKLISKATGQHHRSKSTAVSPSVSAGALPFPPRDNAGTRPTLVFFLGSLIAPAVKNTLNKLRGQRHNRGTSRDTLRVKGEDGGAEDDDTASLQTWDKTPSLTDSTRFGSASSLTDDGMGTAASKRRSARLTAGRHHGAVHRRHGPRSTGGWQASTPHEVLQDRHGQAVRRRYVGCAPSPAIALS